MHSRERIEAWLVERLADHLGEDPAEIDVDRPFEAYGIGSRAALSVSGELEEWLGIRLPATLLFDHPTAAALARHLGDEPDADEPRRQPDGAEEPVAIVGIGCRFPKADSPRAFWQMLRSGADAITEVPSQRWDADAYYDPDPTAPGRMNSRWGGFLDHVDTFDAGFSASPDARLRASTHSSA